MRKRHGVALSTELRRNLEKYVKTHGERKAAATIGLNFATLLRALAKFPVQAGTAALIERALNA